MARPKATDPKVQVSFRVKQSVLSAYEAMGDDWRERMHEALERGLEPVAAVSAPAGPLNPEIATEPVVRAVERLLKHGPKLVGFHPLTGEAIYSR